MMHAWGRSAVLVMLLSLLLVAETSTAASLTTLVVNVEGGPSSYHAPMFVGIAKGTFEKYGLAIRLTAPAGSGFGAVQEVVDGNMQVGAAAPAVIAQMMAQGARLKSIFAATGDASGMVTTDRIFAVVTRRTSGIREGHLEDLRGKRIGLLRGAIGHQYLFYALTARGVNPLTDVTIVPTPGPGLRAALQSGSVDAIVISEPATSQILNATSDAFVVQRGGNHIQYLILRVVSSQYLATHPGTIKRYITAFAEAAQYVRAHSEETADIVLPQLPGLSRATLQTIGGFPNPDVRVSKVTSRAAAQGYDFAIKIGVLTRAPTLEEMFDTRILRQVEREHPEFFKDLMAIPELLRL